MPNINAPNGFRAVKHITGAPYNGQVNAYAGLASDNTATFIGDIVKLTGTGGAGTGMDGIPSATSITAVTDMPVGVVVGFQYDPNNLSLRYRLASTNRTMYVVDSPDVIFEAQDSGTTAVTDVGLNIQPTFATAGSTTTGQSGMQLDGTTKATTSTHMFQIQRVVQRPNVELGANGRFEVRWNRHQFIQTVAASQGVAGV